MKESLESRTNRQIKLEETYRERSLERSKALVQRALESGNAGSLPAAQRLIAAAYDTVAEALDNIKAQKTAGVGGKYRAFLRLIPTKTLAVLALTKCFSLLVFCGNTSREGSNSAQAVLSALGRQVQAELLSVQLSAVAPAYMNRVHEYLKERNTTSASHILKTLRASAENVHYGHEPWSNSQCISVGKLVMQAVWETGLFQWKKNPWAQYMQLEPSDTLAEVFEDVMVNADTVHIQPPMLVPPQPHDTLFSGGYLTNIDHRGTYRNKQITRAMKREVAEAFKEAKQLRAALNKAQEVPYKINKAMLERVQEARALGVGIGMPSSNPAPKPEWRLHGQDKDTYTEREQDEFKEWKVRMRSWYADENTRVGQMRSLLSTVQMAEEFKDEEELYFPTCVDWRYRLYFKSSLHPQGTDICKAMLCFAKGKVLGERGLFWLKVHVATCYGYDKTLFKDRAAWVDTNIDIIRDTVRKPFDSEAFKLADSPWCFLAAATELVNALDSGNPEAFVSYVPVAMDATNSGSQHYSAMLRDPIGGRLTNLFWEGAEQKADMYMDVKERTDSKVIMDLDNPETVVQATYWRENAITRSMTKRPCMTYVYSATVRSCCEYIVLGAQGEGYEPTEEYSMYKLAGYLAPRMRQAVEDANPAAAAAMRYAQQITGRVPIKQHLQWKTPLGGLVINRYSESEEVRVWVSSMNITSILAYNVDYEHNNRRKAKSGIAPNFVHSLDSTHLMMVILAFDGDIVPIHDSVATHAADVDALHKAIREQFYKLYTEHDPLQDLADAAVACGADISDLEMPQKGDLDLKQVLDSPFFFC